MSLVKTFLFTTLFFLFLLIPVIFQVNLFYIIIFNLFSLFLMFSFLILFMTSLSSFFYFVMIEISELLFVFSWFSGYFTAMFLGFLTKFGFILLILQKMMFIEASSTMEWMVWSVLVNLNFLILMSIIMNWTISSSMCLLCIMLGALVYALSWANFTLTIFSCMSSMTHWAVSLETSFWNLFLIMSIYIFVMFLILNKTSNLGILAFIILSSFPLTPLFFLKINLISVTFAFSFLLFLILITFALLSIFLFESFLSILEKQTFQSKMFLFFVIMSEILMCLLNF